MEIDGFSLGIDLFWTIVSAEPMLTLGIIGIFLGTLAFGLIVNLLREQRLKRSGILEVDKMLGMKFEEFLQVLKLRGYDVQLTPASGDYGADLVLKGNGKKIVVQAKRYKKNVGVKAVQEIVSAKSHYKADECWVITNSYYTDPAKKLASSNRVRLIDRKELMSWMIEMERGA